MALVKIEDYQGDLVSKTIMDTLEIVGIENALNTRGYHISVLPLPSDIVNGMIDDTSSKHLVIIERNKYIATMSPKEFRQLENSNDLIDNIIDSQDVFNADFDDNEGKEIMHEISHDESGYVWYKHKVSFNTEKSVLETYDGYVNRVFASIADYTVETFDRMASD